MSPCGSSGSPTRRLARWSTTSSSPISSVLIQFTTKNAGFWGRSAMPVVPAGMADRPQKPAFFVVNCMRTLEIGEEDVVDQRASLRVGDPELPHGDIAQKIVLRRIQRLESRLVPHGCVAAQH